MDIQVRKMKGRRSVLWKRVACMVMTVAFLAGHALSVLPVASAGTVDSHVDYAQNGSRQTWALPSSVLAALLGDGVLSAEGDYLDHHSACRVYYSMAGQGVYRAYAYGDGVRVLAKPYQYETADGKIVAWEPLYSVSDLDMQLLEWSEEDQAYRADLVCEDTSSVSVSYVTWVTLPQTVAEELTREAYLAAVQLNAAMTSYLALHDAWSLRNAPYQTYLAKKLAHDQAVQDHRDYLDAMESFRSDRDAFDAWWEAHDRQSDLFDAYMVEKEAYDAAERAYWAWSAKKQAYDDYMDLVASSPELKAQYEADVTAAREQLILPDSMYEMILMDGDCGFYELLCSETVAEILSRKDELESLGGNRQDIKAAEKSTNRLKELLGVYSELATEKERYDFYITYYAEIATNITSLSTALKNLSAIPAIMKQIAAQGADTKKFFAQFLAVLYEYQCLMDDTKTRDPSQTFVDWSLDELVQSDVMPTDTNRATPTLTAWPEPPRTADDVEAVPYPGEAPERLPIPDPVSPPLDASLAPAEPVEPDEVLPAGDPPVPVDHPGDEPIRPAMDEYEENLYEAYLEGEILEREGNVIQNLTVQIEHTYEVQVKENQYCTVTFYDKRGLELGQFEVAFGGSAVGLVTPPVMRDENRQPLPFLGWRLDGTEDTFVSLDYISYDMVLYATYGTNQPQESNTETESDTEIESVTETDSVTETEIETESETVTVTETETETATETATDTESVTESETESELETESESESDTAIATETESVTETETEGSVDTESQPESTTDTEAVTDDESEMPAATETQKEFDSDTEAMTTTIPSPTGCGQTMGCQGCRSVLGLSAMTVWTAVVGACVSVRRKKGNSHED